MCGRAKNSTLALRPAERHVLNISILEEIHGLYHGFERKGYYGVNFDSSRNSVSLADTRSGSTTGGNRKTIKEKTDRKVEDEFEKEKIYKSTKGKEEYEYKEGKGEECSLEDDNNSNYDDYSSFEHGSDENYSGDCYTQGANINSDDMSSSVQESDEELNFKSKRKINVEGRRIADDGNRNLMGLYDIGRALNTKVCSVGRKATVMVIGNISAGKSTLINWILQENVQKTGMAIETCGITYVIQGKQNNDIGGETALLLLPELREVVKRNPSLLMSLSVKTCSLNSIRFSNINFIDTPGLSDGDSIYSFDIDGVLRDIAENICDLILVCIDSTGNALSKRLIEISRYLAENLSSKTRFILTKIDEIPTEEDRVKVMCQVTQNLTSKVQMKHGFDLIPIFVPGAKDGSYLTNYKVLFEGYNNEQISSENLNTSNVRARSNKSNSNYLDKNSSLNTQNLPTLNRIKDVIILVEKIVDRKVQNDIMSLLSDSSMLLKISKKLIKEQTEFEKNKTKVSRQATVYWSSACFVLFICVILGAYQLSLNFGSKISLFSALFGDSGSTSLTPSNESHENEEFGLPKESHKQMYNGISGILWFISLLAFITLTFLYRNIQKEQTKMSPESLHTFRKYHKILKFTQLRAAEIYKLYVNN